MSDVRGLKKAIDAAGNQTILARKLGFKRPGAVNNWLNRNKRVPAERVLAVEAATGVSRHELRPDLYPEGA